MSHHDTQKSLLERSVTAAGPRYTPKIHVQLPLVDLFDGLGRTKNYWSKFDEICREFFKFKVESNNGSFIKLKRVNAKLEETTSIAVDLRVVLTKIKRDHNTPFPAKEIEKLCQRIQKNLRFCLPKLYELERSFREKKAVHKRISNSTLPSEKIGWIIHEIRNLDSAIQKLVNFVTSPATKLANQPILWLKGEAGTGKTHLLCDISSTRIKDGLPTFLFLGQFFRGGNFWMEFGTLTNTKIYSKRDFIRFFKKRIKKETPRTIILIDALNESTNPEGWRREVRDFISVAKEVPGLGFALSCRTTYEQSTIDKKTLHSNSLIKTEHRGFVGSIRLAATTFFKEFGINGHEIPLVPEFSNPLFLKSYCRTLKSQGKSSPAVGTRGMTWIIEEFYKAVDNEEVSKKLNYNHRLQEVKSPCWDAAKKIADSMAKTKSDEISKVDAQEICSKIIQSRKISGDLYSVMVHAGLLYEDYFYKNGERIDQRIVRFPYQKFSDFLVCRSLLANISANEIQNAFQQGASLYDIVEKPWRYSGLIEALSSLFPEWYGKELIDVVKPDSQVEHAYQQGFLQSIVWRNWESRKAKTEEAVGAAIRLLNLQRRDEIIECLLTVATLSNHPMNAKLLHRNLFKISMPKRDSWWNDALNNLHGTEESCIWRLMEWSYYQDYGYEVDSKSIDLATTVLCWFFTSPNRPLRDRATKALARMLSNNLSQSEALINRFARVNDPYVLERLLAAIYGATLKTTDNIALQSLAQVVYKQFFRSSKRVPSNILTRDYARGIVEAANARIKLSFDIKRVQPPYKSKWPSKIPSLKSLEKRFEENAPEKGVSGLQAVYYSVAGGLADFGTYIIGRDSQRHWLAEKIDGSNKKKPIGQAIRDFTSSLSREQSKLFKKIKTDAEIASYANVISFLEKEEDEKSRLLAESVKKSTDEFSTNVVLLKKTLSSQQEKLFSSRILPFLESREKKEKPEFLSTEIIKRYVLNRVLTLGYNQKLHGQYDEFIRNYHDRDNRRGGKSERIGKKYQWIAYYEALAKISDTFMYTEGYSGKIQEYNGPWQLSSIRNIDPSCLLSGEKDDQDLAYVPIVLDWPEYSYWYPELTDREWMNRLDCIPSTHSLIFVKGRTVENKKRNFVALETIFSWDEEKLDEGTSRRDFFIRTESFLIKNKDLKQLNNSLDDFSNKHSFSGGGDFTDCFLGERYWSPCYKYLIHELSWQSSSFNGKKISLASTTEEYSGEKSDYDCSTDKSMSLTLPSVELYRNYKLSWTGKEGRYFDSNGSLVAFEAKLTGVKPSALLIDKEYLSKMLIRKKLSILWAIIGEKQIVGGSTSRKWPGRLELRGYAIWNGKRLISKLVNSFSLPHRNE